MTGVMEVGQTWKWADTYWKVVALYRMPNGRDVARLRSLNNGKNKKVWADNHPGWVIDNVHGRNGRNDQP